MLIPAGAVISGDEDAMLTGASRGLSRAMKVVRITFREYPQRVVIPHDKQAADPIPAHDPGCLFNGLILPDALRPVS